MEAAPAILNRHHLHGNWPAGSLYVGRGTVLGNPIQIDEKVTREEAVDRYAEYLKERVARGDPDILTALIGAARASSLICSCAPARCHAEVVREQALNLARAGVLLPPPSYRYAGIGSRKTPTEMLGRIQAVARRLTARGFTLLSGAADGADSAFEAGADGKAQIFLPWQGFNGHPSEHYLPHELAHAIASTIHPAWTKLGEKERLLHARNCSQILGADLHSPVDFVVCWTADGCETEQERTSSTGGTGQAIALADRWGIPVFNLSRPDALERIKRRIDEIDAGFAFDPNEPIVPDSMLDFVNEFKHVFPGTRVTSVHS